MSIRSSARAVLVLASAFAVTVGLALPASAAPGSASRNGLTLSASNASGLVAAGETVTVTGTGYSPTAGYYVALCQVPDDYEYGVRPSPCAGGDGQGGVTASAWVTNAGVAGNPSSPIAADGSFTTQIWVTKVTAGLDCGVVTCAIVSRRDHLASSNRDSDVFIPVSW